MSKYGGRNHFQSFMVHLLYVLRDSQSEDGGLYTKKNEGDTRRRTRRRHRRSRRYHKEHDKTPPLHIHNCISVIYTCLHKQRKCDAYLSQIQERRRETYQIIPIQSPKNNRSSYSTDIRLRRRPRVSSLYHY